MKTRLERVAVEAGRSVRCQWISVGERRWWLRLGWRWWKVFEIYFGGRTDQWTDCRRHVGQERIKVDLYISGCTTECPLPGSGIVWEGQF